MVADPKPTITWYLGDKVVKEDTRHKYALITDKHTHLASLQIMRVTASDAGVYKLIAKNSKGEGVANISLYFEAGKIIIPPGKAPRFPTKPVIKQVGGGDLLLECLLEANPLPTITWYHGNNVVKGGPRHRIAIKEKGKDTYLLSLEVKDPEAPDGGNYRCHAVNDLGESNANIAINFQEEVEEEEEDEEITPPVLIPRVFKETVRKNCMMMVMRTFLPIYVSTKYDLSYFCRM